MLGHDSRAPHRHDLVLTAWKAQLIEYVLLLCLHASGGRDQGFFNRTVCGQGPEFGDDLLELSLKVVDEIGHVGHHPVLHEAPRLDDTATSSARVETLSRSWQSISSFVCSIHSRHIWACASYGFVFSCPHRKRHLPVGRVLHEDVLEPFLPVVAPECSPR